MIIEIIFLLVVFATVLSYMKKRVNNFPPGPIGLPLLGHLPLLGSSPHKTLWDWKKTYGPLIGIWFGSYRTVVINDPKLIRESMNMNAFAGRPKLNLFTDRCEDGIIRGIFPTEGVQCMEQRRFTLKTFRDFGYGTHVMGVKVQEEIRQLLNSLLGREGERIQVKNLFSVPVLNALWIIMFGDRVKEDDPESKAALRGLTSAVDEASFLGNLAMFLPWFAKMAPKLSGFERTIGNTSKIKRFMQKQIQIHSIEYVENHPRDYVDAFVDEVQKTSDPHSSFHSKNDVMLYSLIDLFGAGAETTSNTLAWLCAYLIHYKTVQRKLHEEIDGIIGKERVPSLEDRSSMPYTEAVINEVLRFSSVAPIAMHSTTEDITFHGFFIPKDTMVIGNLYGVNFDETIWGDPQNFRPERFIGSDGKFKKNENLMAFSTGKRVCIGESLARQQLFLFTTSLLQMFDISVDEKLPNLEPNVGMVLSHEPFEMILKKRG